MKSAVFHREIYSLAGVSEESQNEGVGAGRVTHRDTREELKADAWTGSDLKSSHWRELCLCAGQCPYAARRAAVRSCAFMSLWIGFDPAVCQTGDLRIEFSMDTDRCACVHRLGDGDWSRTEQA